VTPARPCPSLRKARRANQSTARLFPNGPSCENGESISTLAREPETNNSSVTSACTTSSLSPKPRQQNEALSPPNRKGPETQNHTGDGFFFVCFCPLLLRVSFFFLIILVFSSPSSPHSLVHSPCLPSLEVHACSLSQIALRPFVLPPWLPRLHQLRSTAFRPCCPLSGLGPEASLISKALRVRCRYPSPLSTYLNNDHIVTKFAGTTSLPIRSSPESLMPVE
jgi:hypothetical protein